MIVGSCEICWGGGEMYRQIVSETMEYNLDRMEDDLDRMEDDLDRMDDSQNSFIPLY